MIGGGATHRPDAAPPAERWPVSLHSRPTAGLQPDRLVKEMRLRGIDGIEAANSYLPEFMADFNRRFAAAPREAEDAHRPVLHGAEELDLILREHHGAGRSSRRAPRHEGRVGPGTGASEAAPRLPPSSHRRSFGWGDRARGKTVEKRCSEGLGGSAVQGLRSPAKGDISALHKGDISALR